MPAFKFSDYKLWVDSTFNKDENLVGVVVVPVSANIQAFTDYQASGSWSKQVYGQYNSLVLALNNPPGPAIISSNPDWQTQVETEIANISADAGVASGIIAAYNAINIITSGTLLARDWYSQSPYDKMRKLVEKSTFINGFFKDVEQYAANSTDSFGIMSNMNARMYAEYTDIKKAALQFILGTSGTAVDLIDYLNAKQQEIVDEKYNGTKIINPRGAFDELILNAYSTIWFKTDKTIIYSRNGSLPTENPDQYERAFANLRTPGTGDQDQNFVDWLRSLSMSELQALDR